MSNYKARITAILDEMEREYEAKVAAAFSAGGEAMRQSILRAAQGPVSSPQVGDNALQRIPDPHNPSGFVTVTPAPRRAPRGSVATAIDNVLTVQPGLSITEIETEVAKLNPEISNKSVGNELRRMERKKYIRDRAGGYRWFLMGSQGNGNALQATEHPSSSTPEQDSDDAAP